MGKTLGLDVGDKRIGVAICEHSRIIAQPHSSISRDAPILNIVLLIEQNDVTLIIVGLPLELDGSVGEQAKKVKNFMKKLNRAILSKNIVCEIKEWDERFSSVQAEEILKGSGLLNSDRSAARDRIAATIILQSYLEYSINSSAKV